MHRGTPATHVALIHHIVMQQCEIMERLHTDCRAESLLNTLSEGIRPHKHEDRPDAFSSC